MGTGTVLAVVMAGFIILLVAKTRVPASDEPETILYTRDQMVGREMRSGGWAFAVIALIILFLAVVMAR